MYCIDTIDRLGGIEQITIAKVNALASIYGNEVWLILANNGEYARTKLTNVSVIDLEIHYYENDKQGGYIHALTDYVKKRHLHRKRLELALQEIDPDVVISTGMSEKNFLPTFKLKSNPVFIREVHFSRSYRSEQAHSVREWLAAKVGETLDYQWYIKKYDKIVVLTEAEKAGTWEQWNKVTVVPNPITKEVKMQSTCDSKITITAGRLMHVKNQDALVNIWAKVVQRHPDWTLQIFGEGPQRGDLTRKIEETGLANHVFLMGFTPEVQEQMAKASIFVLTSQTEGFSLVTLEAMSVGVPTVVYNCPGGIRYLVKDGVTGYLTPLNDEDTFVEKVCSLIENEERRKTMGQAALQESEKYRVEIITQRWLNLFRELLDKKRREKLTPKTLNNCFSFVL